METFTHLFVEVGVLILALLGDFMQRFKLGKVPVILLLECHEL
jgi:hypothetical protein